MEARLRDCAAATIAVLIGSVVECDDEIELLARCLAQSGGDDAAVTCVLRHADAALMRMRWEIFDNSRSTLEQFVNRLDRRHALIVAVRARVIVGPANVLVS